MRSLLLRLDLPIECIEHSHQPTLPLEAFLQRVVHPFSSLCGVHASSEDMLAERSSPLLTVQFQVIGEVFPDLWVGRLEFLHARFKSCSARDGVASMKRLLECYVNQQTNKYVNI